MTSSETLPVVLQEHPAVIPREIPADALLMDAWEASLDVSGKTAREYRRWVERWSLWLSKRASGLFSARREDVVLFRESLAETMTPGSVNAGLVALRSFHSWMQAEGIRPDITSGVRRKKTSSRSSRAALTADDAADLLEAVDRDSLKGSRDFAILNLMIRRGLRAVEVCRAKVGDIHTEGHGAYLMVFGKGRDAADQPVPLSDEVLGPIEQWLRKRGYPGPEEPLFCSVSRNNEGGTMTTRAVSAMVKERLRNAGIDDPSITCHSLRHTCATFGLLEGGPESIRDMQQTLRHSSVETTARYAHDLEVMADTGGRAVDSYLDEALGMGRGPHN